MRGRDGKEGEEKGEREGRRGGNEDTKDVGRCPEQRAASCGRRGHPGRQRPYLNLDSRAWQIWIWVLTPTTTQP